MDDELGAAPRRQVIRRAPASRPRAAVRIAAAGGSGTGSVAPPVAETDS